MVLFGGTDVTENSSSAIYILDVKTAQWTAGKAANVNQARCNMACAVAGDSFIAWGGTDCNLFFLRSACFTPSEISQQPFNHHHLSLT